MAITYRAGNTASGTTSCTITKPASTASGDVMYAAIVTDTGTVTPPSGWTALQTGTNGLGNRLSTFRKVAGGSEPANYAFSGGSGITQGNIDGFIGVDNTTPEDATTTIGTGSAATVTFPSITTVTNNAWHMTISGDPGGSVGTPSTYTARTVSAAGYAEGSTKDITTAGAVTGVTATGGVDWIAVSIAMRPAGAATTSGRLVNGNLVNGSLIGSLAR